MNVIDYITKPKQQLIIEDSNNLNITIPDIGADRDVDVVIKNPLLLPLKYNNDYRIVSEYLLESGSLDIVGDDRLGTENTLDILGDGSCVGLYKFDDNVEGNPTTATINGTESYGKGVHNNAFIFDGNTSITIDYSSTDVKSFSLFVKTPNTSKYQIIGVFKRDNKSIGGAYFKDNKIYFFVRNNNGDWNTFAGVVVNDNEWYHIVYNYNTNHQEGYVNGKLIGSADITTYSDNDKILKLGRFVNDRRPLTGSIDQVRLFNKMLNNQEIIKVMME